MRIDENTYNQMPPHLQQLFRKLPNPGSEEVLAGFPVSRSAYVNGETAAKNYGKPVKAGMFGGDITGMSYTDTGSAARFFYCAKASKRERGAYNDHPTVKPLALLRYLCRLTRTPTGGAILDPFMGSGSTLLAARAEGRRAIGIEQDEHSCEIAVRRLEEQREPDPQRNSMQARFEL